MANLLLSELRDMEESPLRTFIWSIQCSGVHFLRAERVFIEIDGIEH